MVLGRKITVIETPPIETEYGSFAWATQTIRINNDLDPATRRRVLTHEIMHAALAIAGISQYHLSDTAEESVCVVAESAFEDVFEALRRLK